MSKSEFRAETYQDLLDEHVKLRGMLRDLESRFAERRGPFTERCGRVDGSYTTWSMAISRRKKRATVFPIW